MQCQETFIQFFFFLRANLKPEEYARRMPQASMLVTDFHVPAELAMCLARPIYMMRINVLAFIFDSFFATIFINGFQALYAQAKKKALEAKATGSSSKQQLEASQKAK